MLSHTPVITLWRDSERRRVDRGSTGSRLRLSSRFPTLGWRPAPPSCRRRTIVRRRGPAHCTFHQTTRTRRFPRKPHNSNNIIIIISLNHWRASSAEIYKSKVPFMLCAEPLRSNYLFIFFLRVYNLNTEY